MRELCDTKFWDANSTWNTDRPQLSPCFRDTILVWLPAYILILATIRECSFYHHDKFRRGLSKTTIPWNSFNISRILITITLFELKLFEALSPISVASFDDMDYERLLKIPNFNTDQAVASFLAPFIQAGSYLVLTLIYYYQKRNGRHTSGPIWYYLFTLVFCDSFNFVNTITQLYSTQTLAHISNGLQIIHYPLIFLLFLLECRGDEPIIDLNVSIESDPRPCSPQLTASFFSRITFSWFSQLLWSGCKRELTVSNLWKTIPQDRVENLVCSFRDSWLTNRKRPKQRKQKKSSLTYRTADGRVQRANSVLRVILGLCWTNVLFAFALKFVQDILQYLTPLILKRFLKFMSSQDEPAWHGAVFSALFLILPTIQSIIQGNFFHMMHRTGIQVRSMLIGFIYRKSLLLSGSSRRESTIGEIVNLMAVDSQRFQDLSGPLYLVWSGPLQIIFATVLIYQELGWSVFAGLFALVLVIPCNTYLARRVKMEQVKLMKIKDENVRQIHEMLNGIKVIKLYAWEKSFVSNIKDFRRLELKYLRYSSLWDAVQNFVWMSCPFFVSLITFAVFTITNQDEALSAEKAFVTICLFNMIKHPLTTLPQLITSLVLTFVSSKRLDRFLNSNELVRYVDRRRDSEEAISITRGTVSWSENERATLTDIDLHVRHRSFVAIVGQVASGKSSLLSAILGEMYKIKGEFNICKSHTIAYVPQQAWIQNMSVKENILFGMPSDDELYEKILDACALQPDLNSLPAGDLSEIGEKGINLSGGQKQRVSLARACYSNSEIYLLDDPLSSVDSHVAKHLFDKVLNSRTGFLKDKTRLLATNSLFVLPYVDQVIVLDGGKIVESGTYEELMLNEQGYLTRCMRKYNAKLKEECLDDIDASPPSNLKSELPERQLVTNIQSKKSFPNESGQLIGAEKVETGRVKQSVYLNYFKYVSYSWVMVIVILFTGSSIFNMATNLWLVAWSSDTELTRDSRSYRLLVYTVLGFVQCILMLFGSIGLGWVTVRASEKLYFDLLDSVIHSPMSFFETTPLGRVVNRFSKDIAMVDWSIPETLRKWLTWLLQVASTYILLAYSYPSFPNIFIPLIVIYVWMLKMFVVTTRQLKRLESITRSPVYSHFSETLSGTSTIRAYDGVRRFVKQSDDFVDQNQSCIYPNIVATRWVSIRLELFANLMTATAAAFSVYYKSSVGAGLAGLAISYSLNITKNLSAFVRATSDLESNIVSVERILEYTRNQREDLWVKSQRPKEEWPESGAFSLDKYSTKYRADLELVLKDVSIDIKAKERLGIVGRTGSGKSTLSLSLFRILEPTSGTIMLDNQNVLNFGLHDLRSKLTIIPQDPVLFSGSLRFNLDPLKANTDDEIWRALRLAHLEDHVKTLKAGLEFKVNECGENFSQGQRQLICLARAVLRKSKVLVLDEATASVDLETDSIVQKTIRDFFRDCTVITIAHRLHTILDSDRILVLDEGRVKELDSPENLLANSGTIFSSLARDAGIDIDCLLKQSHTKS